MKRFTPLALFGAASLIFMATGYRQSHSMPPSPSGNNAVYPTKPVRIIAANPATAGDLLARHLAQRLNERWRQPVVVENRGGAGATIAAEAATKAAPDGYTLHIGQLASLAAAPSLHKTLRYDPVKDFAPITFYAELPLVLLAHPSVPAATLQEFISYAAKRPGGINYSSAGIGTGSHLTTEMLKYLSGLKLVPVHYKGTGAAMTAVIAGEVPFATIVLPNALAQIRAGKARAYAITSKSRFAGAPEIPTAHEAGLAGLESTTWFGMLAPARTPASLLHRLNRDIREVLHAPATEAWLLSQGAVPSPGTPAEFAAIIKSESAKWKKIIELSGANGD
jgi:tripartite-type tricarboxylate transporter receptor subunit TctC